MILKPRLPYAAVLSWKRIENKIAIVAINGIFLREATGETNVFDPYTIA